MEDFGLEHDYYAEGRNGQGYSGLGAEAVEEVAQQDSDTLSQAVGLFAMSYYCGVADNVVGVDVGGIAAVEVEVGGEVV